MKKGIIAFTLIAGSCLQANEMQLKEPEIDLHSSYGYGAFGIGPLPVPAFPLSVGRRTAMGERFSFDTGLSLATLIRYNALRAYVNGLGFIGNAPDSRYYLGLGASVGGVFGVNSIYDSAYAAPNILFGKEFLNSKGKRRFFQVEAMYPPYWIDEKQFVNFAFFTLKYGMAF